jgi:hypothetical protein
MRLAQVVGCPLVHMLFFTATGNPVSLPNGWPL